MLIVLLAAPGLAAPAPATHATDRAEAVPAVEALPLGWSSRLPFEGQPITLRRQYHTASHVQWLLFAPPPRHGKPLTLEADPQTGDLAGRFWLEQRGTWLFRERVDGKTTAEEYVVVSSAPPPESSRRCGPEGGPQGCGALARRAPVGRLRLYVPDSLSLYFDPRHAQILAGMLGLELSMLPSPPASLGQQADGAVVVAVSDDGETSTRWAPARMLGLSPRGESGHIVLFPQHIADTLRARRAEKRWRTLRELPFALEYRYGVTYAIEHELFYHHTVAFLPGWTTIGDIYGQPGTLASGSTADVFGGQILDLPARHPYRRHYHI
jgi:hypothetical protein